MKHTSLAAVAVATSALLSVTASIGPASADQPKPDQTRRSLGSSVPHDEAPVLPEASGSKPAPVEALLDTAESALGLPDAEQSSLGATTAPADLTLILRDLNARRDEMTKSQRQRTARLLARPTNSGSALLSKYKGGKERVRCTKHVCVHWARKGVNRPAAKDKNHNSVPDWVETTSKTMKHVWRAEVTKRGYRAPRSDKSSKRHGPNGKLDIYLANLRSGYYGYCTTDDPKRGKHRAVSGYCVLDNDYKRSQFHTAPIKALRVTAAHEFFHAVQFGYDWKEDSWLMEGTAVWMEEQVYDAINDNRQYLKVGSAHTAPWLPLDLIYYSNSEDTYHQPYGTWSFFQYLSEKKALGRGIVHRIWNYADNSTAKKPGKYSLPAIKAALAAKGTSLTKMWAGYSAANLRPKAFYSEGSAYPTAPSSSVSCAAAGCTLTVPELLHLSSWSAKLTISGKQTLTVTPSVTGSSAFGVTITTQTASGYKQKTSASGSSTFTVDVTGVTNIWVTVANAGIRMNCHHGSPYSCKGKPLDDATDGDSNDSIGTVKLAFA
ncbi:MAG: hypothetical protein QM655_06840 [Nocardioidaceae bacterium]